MKHLRFFLVLCMVFAGSSLGLLQAQTSNLTEEPCPFYVPPATGALEGEGIRCFYLTVPEDRQDSDSAEIELALAVLQRNNTSRDTVPVIYLEGGPGGSALSSFSFWFESALLEDHDIILLDQRGTGYSYPSLNCFEADGDSEDYIQECRDRLVDEGINLSAYNSAESAADVVDLMDAFGLDEINLFGVSYGTRLALTIMRDAPERVRSAIIDAVYPVHVNGYDEQALLAHLAFETLFDDCAEDAACNARFPELRAVFYETIDALNESPLLFEYEDGDQEFYGETLVETVFQNMYDASLVPFMPAYIYAAAEGDMEAMDIYATGSPDTVIDESDISVDLDGLIFDLDNFWLDYFEFDDVNDLYGFFYEEIEVNEDFFEELIDSMLIFAEDLDEEDQVILYAGVMGYTDVESFEVDMGNMSDSEFDDRAFGAIVGLLMQIFDDNDGDSEGSFNSVECIEELPFNSLEQAEALSAEVPDVLRESLLLAIEGQFADCVVWDVLSASSLENDPVVSDVPTLVLSGRYDPITPPVWGDAAAEYLSNSVHIVLSDMGHGAVDTNACATQIALDFLADPASVSDLDLSCVDSVPRATFYIPD